jgi:hypothetical protein
MRTMANLLQLQVGDADGSPREGSRPESGSSPVAGSTTKVGPGVAVVEGRAGGARGGAEGC